MKRRSKASSASTKTRRLRSAKAVRPKRQRNANDIEWNRLESALEEGLQETFPASDPVAVTEPRRQFARIQNIESAHGTKEADKSVVAPHLGR